MTAAAAVRADPARERTLADIRARGLEARLDELETDGFTVLRGVLDAGRVARAKRAVLERVARGLGRPIDPDRAVEADFRGMQYVPYMLYDDPVFTDILLEPAPLALVTWLLGESCLLSSIGCHFRGPGGAPLMIHSDNANGAPPPFSEVSMVANVNYALTPYTRAAGALAMIPGSHRAGRQPGPGENFSADGLGAAEALERARRGEPVAWRDPPGLATMILEPGDAVVWHGNTWHGGHVRELPGVRMNLSAFFCRQHIRAQEDHAGPAREALLAERPDAPRLAALLGKRQPYGWREEGPDYAVMAKSPRGRYD